MQTASVPQILTVDDDPVITRLVKLFLERTTRYVVHIENQSTSAKETALQIRPQLILLDLNMPGTDGCTLRDEIRSDEVLRETPILILTGALSSSEAARYTRNAPKTQVLAKPFNAQMLLKRVDEMLAI